MRTAIIALCVAAVLVHRNGVATEAVAATSSRASTPTSGCKWMSNGDTKLLLSRAKWIAGDSAASRIRSEAGVAPVSPDSVMLVTTSALCDSLNTLVVSRLSTFSKTLPSTWNGVAVAKLRGGLYLVDPIDGESSNRWYFLVRPDSNAVYFFAVGW